jgi:hypothetical protein
MRARLAAWRLPDEVLVEVFLRAGALADRPADRLERSAAVFDGMILQFAVIDPRNRFAEYRFALRVVYGQDEQTLHIVNGVCEARFV